MCVLFISIGHPGQFYPLFAIAKAYLSLVQSTPIYFASAKLHREAVQGAGLEFLDIWAEAKIPDHVVQIFNDSGLRNVSAMVAYSEWIRSGDMYDQPRKLLEAWIQSEKPDIVICDVLSEAGLVAALNTKTPYIINCPVPPYTLFPEALPLLFPPVGSGTSVVKNSISHRIYDFVAVVRYAINLQRLVVPKMHEQNRRGIPYPNETAAGASLVLLNTAPSLGDRRAVLPTKARYVGSALCDAKAEYINTDVFETAWNSFKLQHGGDILEWVERSENPVVLIAFGTMYHLDAARVHVMYKVLESLRVSVLWKILPKDSVHLPENAKENKAFYFVEWLPDIHLILAHPNVRLFVNHGGANSVNEGLYFAKPQVLLPAWMDCFDFAMRCQEAKAGISIDTAPCLDASSFYNAIFAILFGKDRCKFIEAAREIANEMRSLGGAACAARTIYEEQLRICDI